MKRDLSVGILLKPGEEFALERKRAEWLYDFSLRPGALVSLQDQSGRWFRCRITQYEPSRLRLKPFEEMAHPAESKLTLALLQAVPNKERMELIIEKAVELGADLIQPFFSARSCRLSELPQSKWRRWQERARKASGQCRRGVVPQVAAPLQLEQAAEVMKDAELKLVLYEGERERGLQEMVRENGKAGSCVLASGPEGGFAPEEVALLQGRGFAPVSLGGRILRAETSAILAVGIVQFCLGDLGKCGPVIKLKAPGND